jgi:hypothetical protein
MLTPQSGLEAQARRAGFDAFAAKSGDPAALVRAVEACGGADRPAFVAVG